MQTLSILLIKGGAFLLSRNLGSPGFFLWQQQKSQKLGDETRPRRSNGEKKQVGTLESARPIKGKATFVAAGSNP